jgi:hypothetical protein
VTKVLSSRELWLIGAPLLGGLSAVYLLGYWGALGINFLEYIGLADLGKLALYGLFPAAASFAAGHVLSVLASPMLPPGGGSGSPIGRFGLRHARWLLAFVSLVILLLVVLGREPEKWFLIAPLVGVFGVALTHSERIISAIPDPRLRATLMSMVVLLPTLAYAYGRSDAHLALQPGTATTVEVERSGMKDFVEPGAEVIYLGLLGDTYALHESSTGRTILMKRRDAFPLVLNPKHRK